MTQSVSETIISPVILKWLSVSVNISNERASRPTGRIVFFIRARFADICEDEGFNDQSALLQGGTFF